MPRLVGELALACLLFLTPSLAAAQAVLGSQPNCMATKNGTTNTWTGTSCVIDGDDIATVQAFGRYRFNRFELRDGAVLIVTPYNGTNPSANTPWDRRGNLEIVANEIVVSANSRIDARGAGYQTPICGEGGGPTAYPTAGGRGGCSVRDSGGGGAHFGNGGQGTKDCFLVGSRTSCQFPWEFEHDCNRVPQGGSCVDGGTGGGHGCWVQNGEELSTSSALVSTCSPPPNTCTNSTCCYNPGVPISSGYVPTVSGKSYWHTVYDVEFGAAGGDKGCRDGYDNNANVAGAGGGRVVLVAANAGQTGSVQLSGTIRAGGKRGCGIGNDSGGGGAGGSVLIVGDQVQVASSASVSAAGGLGGDTTAACDQKVSCSGVSCSCSPTGSGSPAPDFQDCPSNAQKSGTCDDCGGGGGGGIIAIQSRTRTLSSDATFNVSGAAGGTCAICQGEAGGGAGELQLDGAYVGELCDGYDNDFDGQVDEGFGNTTCGVGSCVSPIPMCQNGAPASSECDAPAEIGECKAPFDDARPRVAVILDTSASMLLDLSGQYPTFGDGSSERPGLDTNGNGQPDDSRLFLARESLAQVISAYPEIDFALSRYHQDQGENRSCQTAAWFECQNLVASYDNPTNNTGADVCNVRISASQTVPVKRNPNGDHCINYAGSCGSPRRGADILSGFGSATRDVVRWLDGRETSFNASTTAGDYCNHSDGGDCEVRGSGPTPIAGSLQAVQDYMVPIQLTDPAKACRTYSVILVTDGAESCNGDPVAAARTLHDTYGIEVYVIAVSVKDSERASLTSIARAGSGNDRDATFVTQPEQLVPALTSIISGSLRFERCNNLDDDCDTKIDEDFTGLSMACADSGKGLCQGTGTIVCSADGSGTRCDITNPGQAPGNDVCPRNGEDEDCDGKIDEDLICSGPCEGDGLDNDCDNTDDDCDGSVDESFPSGPCGSDQGICTPGQQRCIAGSVQCIGGTEGRPEVCNGLDDDCDGNGDDQAQCPAGNACLQGACRIACSPTEEFTCPFGYECLEAPPLEGFYCLPTACASCTGEQVCRGDKCVDPCDGVMCATGRRCVRGRCEDCHRLGCPSDKICFASQCVDRACDDVQCGAGEGCFDGECKTICEDSRCGAGRRCNDAGKCVDDPCDGVTCGDGEYCNGGKCERNTCRTTVCPAGDVCVPGRGCVDDPCPVVECPDGFECSTSSSGGARCIRTTGQKPGDGFRYVAGRGGEACAIGAPGDRGATTSLALVMLAMALLVWRRRSR